MRLLAVTWTVDLLKARQDNPCALQLVFLSLCACYAVSAQAQERKLLQAAKEAGTVKRYIPASFGGNLKAVVSKSPPPVQANFAALKVCGL